MIILGVCDGHDSGAALLADGEVVSAVSEERLSRKKRSPGFPSRAIESCLDLAGVGPGDVDLVALADRWGRAPTRLFDFLYRRTDPDQGPLKPASRAWAFYVKSMARIPLVRRAESAAGRREVARMLAKIGLGRAGLLPVSHHIAHAHCAMDMAGGAEALVVTMDGFGDGLAGLAGVTNGGMLRVIREIPFRHSPGILYGVVTQILGFAEGDEGKTLGLAAYGDPAPLSRTFGRMLRSVKGGIEVRHRLTRPGERKRLLRHRREDIAAALQQRTEEVIALYVAGLVRETGRNVVCLAGGLFANVRVNRAILTADGIHTVSVFPHMGDGGLGYGAARSASRMMKESSPARLSRVFLGPGYSPDRIERLLRARGLPGARPPDLEARVARLLARGGIVARFTGRMEFGPRALGHRSILFDPRDRGQAEKLGRLLGRPAHMPFAPATLQEYAGSGYKGLDGGESLTRFMTGAFDCTERMRRTCPAVVHADGTSRPQLVHESDNPSLYGIIDAFREMSGEPTVGNTSLNRHTEPIVCSPEDAADFFARVPVDALAIGPYLVER